MRQAIAATSDELDAAAATAAWERALAVPPHDDPPVWIHGDLHGGNLHPVSSLD